MTKSLLAGAAALALFAGVAFAQDNVPPPPTPTPDGVTATDKQRTVEPNGTEVDRSRTYHRDADGDTMSGSSSDTVKTPYGSSTKTDQHSVNENGVSVDRKTTTTTDGPQ